MSRPIVAQIDLAALRDNVAMARGRAPNAKVMAVVKANAYGHGAVPVAQALQAHVEAFAVCCTEEALELREAGIELPIVLLEGIFCEAELELAVQYNFILTIHQQAQLDWLLACLVQTPLTVLLKLDSGMHRLGFSPDEFVEALAKLQQAPQVAEVIAMTHFACADELDNAFTEQQLSVLQQAIEGRQLATSIANSATILAWPQAAKSQWLRPGIMLYGASPFEAAIEPHEPLSPVMSLRSKVIAIRRCAVGEKVGYGGRFVCQRPTTVAVVACGYADGYPRHAPDGTPVWVAGQNAALIGRVSMDMLTVDVTDLDQVAIGDEVELWGSHLPVNQVATACDTIAYELFTKVTRRVRLDYINA